MIEQILKEFDEMERECDGAYGTGKFPPEVKKFFSQALKTAQEERTQEILEATYDMDYNETELNRGELEQYLQSLLTPKQ